MNAIKAIVASICFGIFFLASNPSGAASPNDDATYKVNRTVADSTGLIVLTAEELDEVSAGGENVRLTKWFLPAEGGYKIMYCSVQCTYGPTRPAE